MAQIIPKLNLNKTPALVESNSFVFAKNIRLDVDGTIHRDYGVFPLSIVEDEKTKDLTFYLNIFNRIYYDIRKGYKEFEDDVYTTTFSKLANILGKENINNEVITKNCKQSIVGVIADSNDFYMFIYGSYKHINDYTDTINKISLIIKYSEKDDKFYPCGCNWNYSGGTIYGCVINNLVGDKILNIGESGTANLVPFKSINLNECTIYDNESIYTQTPNIPITNLHYTDSFACVIPNGTYQFFVRYEIRKDFYTDWFPASHEIFAGNRNEVVTSFGTLKYTNVNRDSDNSFILSIEHLIDKSRHNYKSFQVGFILAHDDATYGRAWKHFDFDTTIINFDYKAEDAEEIEVIELLRSTYGLYNVGNITSFKNKLYISNYTESDFNDVSLQKYANQIIAEISTKEGTNTYDGYKPVIEQINGSDAISGLIINEVETPFVGVNGIFNKIISTEYLSNTHSVAQAIQNAVDNKQEDADLVGVSPQFYGIEIKADIDTIQRAKNKLKDRYKNSNTPILNTTYSFEYPDDTIQNINVDSKDKTADEVVPYIYNTLRYLNTNCNWINKFGKLSDRITIKITRNVKVTRKITKVTNSGGGGIKGDFIDKVDLDIEDSYIKPTLPYNDSRSINRPNTDIIGGGGDSSTSEVVEETTFDDTYDQTIEVKFIAFDNKYTSNNASTLVSNTTLIPYQKYKFYMHFVKESGEITNGYYCNRIGEIEIPYKAQCSSVIYPIFKHISIPKGYSACFFSICHTAVNTATLFNIEDDPSGSRKEASCIDVNMMLNPANKKIHIKQEISINDGTDIKQIETYSGQYYYSSDTSLPRYFGADGVVVFDKGEFSNNSDLAYIVNDYTISETENIELIKCTPYLNANNLNEENGILYFDDYTKMNLLGFICAISPLLRETCIKYYSDGSSVYRKSNDTDNIPSSNLSKNLYLDELNKYSDADDDKKLANFSLKQSTEVYIYSNYNLNYVTLSDEPKMAIKTWYNRPANDTTSATEKEANEGHTILLRLIPSQLMSDIYKLPAMYKSYIRKTYSSYTKNSFTRFDNTVRSSILYGDESKIHIFKFDANDYYNIPTNRGIIINMVAIGDAILVHTQDSMFKFSGSNTLQSLDSEIKQVESTPFDTGVSEIFGSDFGFAGLQNKTDHIITENGYIFFDRDSNIVYLYSGQGQIVRISDTIEKLFRHKNIDKINFANDYYNNRFFMSIMFYDYIETIEEDKPIIKKEYYPVTISFNTSDKIKSFVSLHDFYYHYAFNTKTNCYFLTSDNKDICTINKRYKGCYTKLDLISDKTYPQLKDSIDIIAKIENTNFPMSYTINSYNSIIDVIVNNNFEVVKTLNAVNWCGTKIVEEFREVEDSNVETLCVAEDINFETPCKAIRIYTDTCMTPLNPCSSRSNDSSMSSVMSYQYPRFNQGFWTFNYFRNILNSKGHTTRNNYSSDNNSLIEGKYFVTRFVFDTDFKLETLSINYNNKIVQ